MLQTTLRFLTLGFVSLISLPALAATLTTTAIADAPILPISLHNRGQQHDLYVGSPGIEAKTLVQFSITSIPVNQTIDSATLQFSITDNGNLFNNGRTVDVHRVLASWLEGDGISGSDLGTFGVTWDSRDKGGSLANWTSAGVSGNGTDRVAALTAQISSANVSGNLVTLDVTGDVAAWYSGAASNFGWLLEETNPVPVGGVYIGFASNNHPSAMHPTLIVNYTAIPIPVPEPSSLALLGMSGMVMLARRRSRKAA